MRPRDTAWVARRVARSAARARPPPERGPDLHLCGADDGIRTRDPNLGKVTRGCCGSRAARRICALTCGYGVYSRWLALVVFGYSADQRRTGRATAGSSRSATPLPGAPLAGHGHSGRPRPPSAGSCNARRRTPRIRPDGAARADRPRWGWCSCSPRREEQAGVVLAAEGILPPRVLPVEECDVRGNDFGEKLIALEHRPTICSGSTVGSPTVLRSFRTAGQIS